MKSSQLKAWRKKRGYSQPVLAKLLKVSVPTIARWETDVHPIARWVPFVLIELEGRREVVTAKSCAVLRRGGTVKSCAVE